MLGIPLHSIQKSRRELIGLIGLPPMDMFYSGVTLMHVFDAGLVPLAWLSPQVSVNHSVRVWDVLTITKPKDMGEVIFRGTSMAAGHWNPGRQL